ncbi:MAG: phosphopantetheine-binding protein [Firmicutes bacterium]|nr:phosphopantetheine-binding protein [Bacillota bacterium]
METKKLLEEILKNYRGEEITLNESVTFESLGFDSLDQVDLMMQVEEKFGISFPDDADIKSFDDLLALIERLKK